MTYRRWSYFVISCMIIPVIVLGFTNYVVDPFNIFNSHFLKIDGSINERFKKIKHIDKNHQRYNAYLMGSSRSGTTSPCLIEKYFPHLHFYNLTVAGCNQYDNELFLKYLIDRKYQIKHLYLQVDISDIYGYQASPDNLNARHHPHVTHQSLPLFYLSYLSTLSFKQIVHKIRLNYFNLPGRNIKFDLENTGRWYVPFLDEKIKADPEKYIKEEPSFNQKKIMVGNRGTKLAENLHSLRNIKILADANHIRLTVYIAPHHHNMMSTFHKESTLQYLSDLAKITSYWDFSGYNSITQDDHYYYESSHYREILAELIAKRIFNDKSPPQPPADFGKWVTSQNVNFHLASKF